MKSPMLPVVVAVAAEKKKEKTNDDDVNFTVVVVSLRLSLFHNADDVAGVDDDIAC